MLVFVALALALMSAFHSIVGERHILKPLSEAQGLPRLWGSQIFLFRTIKATWHLVSGLWLALAAYFLSLALAPDLAVFVSLAAFAILFGALAIIPLVWPSGKHKSWIVFGLIALALAASAFLEFLPLP